jgi:hypothetical protein
MQENVCSDNNFLNKISDGGRINHIDEVIKFLLGLMTNRKGIDYSKNCVELI